MFLKKLKVNSGASRSRYLINFDINLLRRNKKLSSKKRAGTYRSVTGRIVCWSKTSIKRRYTHLNIAYKFRVNCAGVISNFNFFNLNRKVATLISIGGGMFAYLLSSKDHKIFSYFFINANFKVRKFFLKTNLTYLFKVKLHSIISNIEITPGSGSTLVRASGSRSTIVKFDKGEHKALIKLPSEQFKFISFFSLVFFDKILTFSKSSKISTKSGDWRNIGFKPTVRGVARNPVDHPHGGRTKSLKLPRTPWGFPTKLK